MRRWIPAIAAAVALVALAIHRAGRANNEVVLEIDIPVVTYAARIDAWRFVGPLDVDGLTRAEVCGDTDRARLLRERKYGWRVLVVDAQGVRRSDGTRVDGKLTDVLWRVSAGWELADDRVEALCGVRPTTDILLAIDASVAYAQAEAQYIIEVPEGSAASRVPSFILVHEAGVSAPARVAIEDVVTALPIVPVTYSVRDVRESAGQELPLNESPPE